MFAKILLLNFTTADLTPESWSRLRRAAHFAAR